MTRPSVGAFSAALGGQVHDAKPHERCLLLLSKSWSLPHLPALVDSIRLSANQGFPSQMFLLFLGLLPGGLHLARLKHEFPLRRPTVRELSLYIECARLVVAAAWPLVETLWPTGLRTAFEQRRGAGKENFEVLLAGC